MSRAFDFKTEKPTRNNEMCLGCHKYQTGMIKVLRGEYRKWAPQFICQECTKSILSRF